MTLAEATKEEKLSRDDSIPLADPGGDDGQVESSGAAGDGYGVTHSKVGSHGLLKTLHHRPHTEVGRTEHLIDQIEL